MICDLKKNVVHGRRTETVFGARASPLPRGASRLPALALCRGEVCLLLGRGGAAQQRVAVREAAKALDDSGVVFGEARGEAGGPEARRLVVRRGLLGVRWGVGVALPRAD